MAEFLNSKGILWKRGQGVPYFLGGYIHNYFPDFYLPLYDKYVEVKGYYLDKDKTKMAAVLSQNKISLFMAFKKEMDHLEDFLKKVLA